MTYEMIDIRNCDNLELLNEMPSNSIDLIYSDILYGTGRDFGDYKDLKPIRSEIEAHYIPRIKEMHRVLKQTGSIWLQMDSRIDHWIRCILDDVFGYSNFVNSITWKRRSSANNVPKKGFNSNKDTILVYKISNDFTFNLQKDIDLLNKKAYYNTDETGRLYRTNPIISKGYNPVRKLLFEGKFYEGCYKWAQETLDANIEKGVKVLANKVGQLVYVSYLDEHEGKAFDDLWVDVYFDCKPRYMTEKPLSLLERIIKAGSNPGDLVADFYLGSGTTAEACEILGRNFIGCDINPNACEIAKSRCISV